jgi:hypothetical protein
MNETDYQFYRALDGGRFRSVPPPKQMKDDPILQAQWERATAGAIVIAIGLVVFLVLLVVLATSL